MSTGASADAAFLGGLLARSGRIRRRDHRFHPLHSTTITQLRPQVGLSRSRLLAYAHFSRSWLLPGCPFGCASNSALSNSHATSEGTLA